MKFKLTIDPEKEEEISIISNSANDFIAKIEDLVLGYNGSASLFAHDDDEIINLEFKEIACITIDDRRTYAVDVRGRKYRINETLVGVEGKVPSYFIRINKSAIANEREIKCFKTAFSGAVDVVFKCGYSDYVSRRCFAEIKRRYNI